MVYAVDTKLEEIDSVFLSAKEDSINNGLALIILDKVLYRKNNNNELISMDDLKELVMIFVLNYFNNYNKDNLIKNPNAVRDIIIKNDKNKIIKYYTKKNSKDYLIAFFNNLIENYGKDLTRKRKK